MNLKGENTTHRKQQRPLLLLLVAGVMLCVAPLHSLSQSANCWPHFRGNPHQSGVSPAAVAHRLQLAWTFETGGEIKSSAVICNNRIVIGSTDGYLYALSKEGELLWKFNTGNVVEAPPLIVDGLVVAGNLSGTVYALDAATGQQHWKFETAGQIHGAASLTKSRTQTHILVSSYDHHLYSINLADSSLVWKYGTDNFLNAAPTTNNRVALVGGCDALLHVVDVQTGRAKKRIEMETYIAREVALSGNMAYFGDYDGTFFAVDIDKGQLAWKYTQAMGNPFLSAPAVSEDKVVIGSHNRQVYCFDRMSGDLAWSFRTRGKIDSSPVIAGNTVITCSNDGWIRFLSLDKGKELGSYELGLRMHSTPAVVNGLLVVGAQDGKVYVFTME